MRRMKKIIIIAVLVLSLILIPQALNADDVRDSLENQVSSLWVIVKSNARAIAELRRGNDVINNEYITIENTVENTFIVEYASHTDGLWTKESFIDSNYRRTGHTYNGITTYVVEKISFCWGDDNTMMFMEN